KGHVRVIGSVPDNRQGAQGRLTFADVRGDALESMKLNVTRENWFSTYQVHHRVADRFRWGRAFLLGDAAHIHSPVGAQGMNTGIGDAVNLAWELADVLNRRAKPHLLDTCARERMAFALRLVATTDRVFSIDSKPGRAARIVRIDIVPRLLPLL